MSRCIQPYGVPVLAVDEEDMHQTLMYGSVQYSLWWSLICARSSRLVVYRTDQCPDQKPTADWEQYLVFYVWLKHGEHNSPVSKQSGKCKSMLEMTYITDY